MFASAHALLMPQLIFHATRPSAAEEAAPLSALVWWLIPLFAFIGAIGYVIWVSKFQTKYENETNRSVGRFQKFQQSLEKDRSFSSTSEKIHSGDDSHRGKMTDSENFHR
jgi:hypothetical protein